MLLTFGNNARSCCLEGCGELGPQLWGQRAQPVHGGGQHRVGYDRRGNLTQSGSDTYQYNTRNQLFMNGQGQLIYRNPAGELGQTPGLNYDWVNGQLALEKGTGSLIRRWVYGPGVDEPLVWYEGSGTNDKRWMVADERGSVVAVTDAGRNALAVNAYDEHGFPGSVYGRFGYTGQIWVADLGMWDYKARMYSPTLGRFMQTDPIGYGDGLNWYAYAHGDAVNGSDPSGTTRTFNSQPTQEQISQCSAEETARWANCHPGPSFDSDYMASHTNSAVSEYETNSNLLGAQQFQQMIATQSRGPREWRSRLHLAVARGGAPRRRRVARHG